MNKIIFTRLVGYYNILNLLENNPIYDQTYEEIRKVITKDEIMSTLFKIFKERRPTTKAEIPLCVRPYWKFRENCTLNMVLYSKELVYLIPTSITVTLVSNIHWIWLRIEFFGHSLQHKFKKNFRIVSQVLN